MARFEDYIQSNETPQDLCREIDELQKKYDELNDFSNSQCKKLLEENEKLKWENKQILEDNDYYQKENEKLLEVCKDKDRQLNNWFISYNEVMKENEELKKAITEKNSEVEKMKCCGNCKHKENKLEDNEICWNCERSCAKFGEEIIKDEWELAEWKN